MITSARSFVTGTIGGDTIDLARARAACRERYLKAATAGRRRRLIVTDLIHDLLPTASNKLIY